MSNSRRYLDYRKAQEKGKKGYKPNSSSKQFSNPNCGAKRVKR